VLLNNSVDLPKYRAVASYVKLPGRICIGSVVYGTCLILEDGGGHVIRVQVRYCWCLLSTTVRI